MFNILQEYSTSTFMYVCMHEMYVIYAMYVCVYEMSMDVMYTMYA